MLIKANLAYQDAILQTFLKIEILRAVYSKKSKNDRFKRCQTRTCRRFLLYRLQPFDSTEPGKPIYKQLTNNILTLWSCLVILKTAIFNIFLK